MYFNQKIQGKGKLFEFLKKWFLNIGGSKFVIIAIWMKVALKAVLIKKRTKESKIEIWRLRVLSQRSTK